MMVIMAEIKTVVDIDLSSRFRQLLGPASLSIRNATDILPIAMLKIHNDLEMVLSSRASESSVGVR